MVTTSLAMFSEGFPYYLIFRPHFSSDNPPEWIQDETLIFTVQG